MEEFAQVFELFFDNHFREALEMASPWERTCLYHSEAKAILCFINAMVSDDKSESDIARDAINQTLRVCYHNKRRSSIIDVLSHVLTRGTTNFDVYSDREVHAELVSAQSRLMLVILDFIKLNDYSSFIRNCVSSLKYCTNSFKLCLDILTAKTNWSDDGSRRDFKSGVQLGVGLLNLVSTCEDLDLGRQLMSGVLYMSSFCRTCH